MDDTVPLAEPLLAIDAEPAQLKVLNCVGASRDHRPNVPNRIGAYLTLPRLQSAVRTNHAQERTHTRCSLRVHVRAWE